MKGEYAAIDCSCAPPYAERTRSRKQSITAYSSINERRRSYKKAHVHSQDRLAVNIRRPSRRLDPHPGELPGDRVCSSPQEFLEPVDE